MHRLLTTIILTCTLLFTPLTHAQIGGAPDPEFLQLTQVVQYIYTTHGKAKVQNLANSIEKVLPIVKDQNQETYNLLNNLLVYISNYLFTLPDEFSTADVADHDSTINCRIIIDGDIFDITLFLAANPELKNLFRDHCGKNMDNYFNTTDYARQRLLDAITIEKNFKGIIRD